MGPLGEGRLMVDCSSSSSSSSSSIRSFCSGNRHRRYQLMMTIGCCKSVTFEKQRRSKREVQKKNPRNVCKTSKILFKLRLVP